MRQSEYLTTKELMAEFRISSVTISKIVKEGRLIQRRFTDGGKVFYLRSEVNAALMLPKERHKNKYTKNQES